MTRPDDPRFLRSREAIVQAARALLLELGPQAVTHAQVADRARVGRATVYRHWPHSQQLLLEAMATVPMPFFADPVRPVRTWLVRELTAIAEQLALDDVRAVSTTLANAALWDEVMDARRDRFARIIGDRLTDALDTAEREGEVRLHLPSRDAAAILVGPLYYRSTMERSPAYGRLIEGALAAVGVWATGG